MSAVIAMDALEVTSGTARLVHGVDLHVAAGETLVLVGPSGCGKTSLLRAILGFLTPSAGRIHLDGRLASSSGSIHLPPERRHLAVVFQDLALWPHLTVSGNLEFGLEMRGVPGPERRARAAAMLEAVSLERHHDRYPGQLSGGERQRVAIARALVLEPTAVLFDEPLASLDVVLKRELLALFSRLLDERGLAAVYVTHDLREGAALGHRFAVMESGRLVQAGALADLRREPATEFVSRLLEDLDWRPTSRGGEQ